MKQLSILITLLVISSLALSGEVYEGLKVKGDYKKLGIIIEKVRENEAGLTTELVERAVKLKLLSNGIKSPTYHPSYLYVVVRILDDGTSYSFHICLEKNSAAYGVDKSVAGIAFRPYQAVYGSMGKAGKSSDFILNHLNERLDKFLLDYLESNME